jgi:arabinose-5-phosphate isomerase
MNILKEAKRVLKIEAEAVLGLIERLNADFEKAIDLISKSSGRVVVTGMGKSGLVGKKIAATLASTGVPSFFLHPAEAIHGDLGMVTKDDVVLAISTSGETDEIVGLIPYLKRFDVSLISMTGNTSSTLGKASDVSIDIGVKEEACPFGVVPTASTTAALAMGDAIAVTLLIRRGLKAEDFAAFHPGGSIGKKLLIKVEDLMHTGDALPLVHPETPMTETLIEMSSKRLGVAVIVDKKNKIKGVLTDGDLRRGIEKWGQGFFGMKVGDAMTKNPKTILRGELAVKALSVMENHSITALIVSDEKGRIEGIIHLHDILRKGIV